MASIVRIAKIVPSASIVYQCLVFFYLKISCWSAFYRFWGSARSKKRPIYISWSKKAVKTVGNIFWLEKDPNFTKVLGEKAFWYIEQQSQKMLSTGGWKLSLSVFLKFHLGLQKGTKTTSSLFCCFGWLQSLFICCPNYSKHLVGLLKKWFFSTNKLKELGCIQTWKLSKRIFQRLFLLVGKV